MIVQQAQVLPTLQTSDAATHEIVVMDKKPSPEQVRQMVLNYFEEHASNYDGGDKASLKRRRYIDTVNRLVAAFIGQERDISKILSVAAGTGRRESELRKMLGERVRFTCNDISPEMCKIAESRGHMAVPGSWTSVNLGKTVFDSILFLYSFGMLVDHEDRLSALRKVNKHLRFQGSLYIDLFNIEDMDEWGPELSRRYDLENWAQKGYDRGDVFYKRVDGDEVSYCHYFSRAEIESLLKSAGMRISRILHIGYGDRPGEVMPTNRRGSMLIRATKIMDI